jgi:hypothetical protein
VVQKGIEDNPGDQLSVRYLVHFDHSNTIYVYRAITTFADIFSLVRMYFLSHSGMNIPIGISREGELYSDFVSEKGYI